MFPFELVAQNESLEEAKKNLYISYLIDEVSFNSYPIDYLFDTFVGKVESNYNDFAYECSEPLELHFSNNVFVLHDKYTVQLFKIPKRYFSYYLLRFNSSSSITYNYSDVLWIRVSGYTENDLKIFIDGLIDKGMTIEAIRSMINLWCQQDSLFDELDWDCLLEGYEKNDTHRKCYVSAKYYLHNAACVNCKYEVVNDNIYSVFSRIILLGRMDFGF